MDKKILKLLVCPLTKTRLDYDEENQELVSQVAGLAYPIKNGIPIMLIDEARIINPDQVRILAPFLIKDDVKN
jgi:uncharacterized protein YbaR (Trm112 family)